MRAEQIRAHLRKEPFQPIRVFISDGSFYDVRHPELMFVTRAEVVIALGVDGDTIPEESAYCDPVHITRIEPMPKPKRTSKRRK